MSRVVCAVLALLGFVALAVVQANLPWAEREESGFGATAKETVRTWSDERSGSFSFFGDESSGSETNGWYEDGWDDEDENAVMQVRIAIPLLLAGAVLLLVGTILCFTGRGPAGSILTLVGGILAAASVLLYFLASQDLLDNKATWMVGFYVALGGALLGIVGGVIGLAGGNMRAGN
jgi:hypothetical protein